MLGCRISRILGLGAFFGLDVFKDWSHVRMLGLVAF